MLVIRMQANSFRYSWAKGEDILETVEEFKPHVPTSGFMEINRHCYKLLFSLFFQPALIDGFAWN